MFFHRYGKVRAAFDGGVIGDDHHLAAVHHADARHHAGRRRLVVVHVVRRQRRQFEKRRAGVHQGVDALARQELVAPSVQRHGSFPTAFSTLRQALAQLANFVGKMRLIVLELRTSRLNLRADNVHNAWRPLLRGSTYCGTSRRRNASA